MQPVTEFVDAVKSSDAPYEQKAEEENSIAYGLNWGYVDQGGKDQVICCHVSDAQLSFGHQIVQQGKRYSLEHKFVVDNAIYPMKFQFPPLLLSSFTLHDKGNFVFAVMRFSYQSERRQKEAQGFLNQLRIYDNKVEDFIVKNMKLFWPHEAVSPEEARNRYLGFSKEQKPYKVEEKKAPEVTQVGELKKEGDEFKIYVPNQQVVKIKGEAESVIPGGKIEEQVSYPPAFTVFPWIAKRIYRCRAKNEKGDAMPMEKIKEGMELSGCVSVQLNIKENGTIEPSAKGLQFVLCELDPTSKNLMADAMYRPKRKRIE